MSLYYEKLYPCEIRAIDALCRHGRRRHCNSAVGSALGISAATAKKHLWAARNKLGMFSNTELVLTWPCELFQIGLRELGMRA